MRRKRCAAKSANARRLHCGYHNRRVKRFNVSVSFYTIYPLVRKIVLNNNARCGRGAKLYPLLNGYHLSRYARMHRKPEESYRFAYDLPYLNMFALLHARP